MLDNNKCILAYKLSGLELDKVKALGYKVIEVIDEMIEMKVSEIVEGYRFKIYKENPPKQKVILFNNFSDKEVQMAVSKIREGFKAGILAVVTDTNKKWKFEFLVEHLVEEREAYRKFQREK